MRLEHGFAQLSEVKLHYVGAGEGPLVLLLHGFPDFSYMWRDQILALADIAKVVAPDLRGYNLSSKPDELEAYKLSHLVQDIKDLAATFEKKQIILVGHDWGGVIAWATAIACPELISKLLIINAPHPTLFRREILKNPAQQRASAYIEYFKRPGVEDLMIADGFAQLKKSFVEPGIAQGYFAPYEVKRYQNVWSRPGAMKSMLNYYRANTGPESNSAKAPSQSNFELQSELQSELVKVETQVLWGLNDTYLLPGLLDGLNDLVPQLKIEKVADASHWLVQEKPDLVLATLRRLVLG